MKKFMSIIIVLWGLVACASQPQEVEVPVAQVTIAVERVTETAVSTHTAVSVGHGFYQVLLFSPNGRFLAIGSHDGTVRLWGVP